MITIFPTEHRKELWDSFKKKAQDQRMTASDLFEKVMEEYLKNGKRPEVSLDHHIEVGHVYPDPWNIIGHPELVPFSEKELEEMARKLTGSIKAIDVEIQKKAAERRQGMGYAKSAISTASRR